MQPAHLLQAKAGNRGAHVIGQQRQEILPIFSIQKISPRLELLMHLHQQAINPLQTFRRVIQRQLVQGLGKSKNAGLTGMKVPQQGIGSIIQRHGKPIRNIQKE